jgi:hypothetical protein
VADDAECDDGNPCTRNECNRDINRCSSGWIPNCCRDVSDCPTRDRCHTSACVAGQCVEERKEDCCLTHAECDDGNICTINRCIGAVCRWGPNPALPGCCNSDAECHSTNPCEVATCGAGHQCRTDPIVTDGRSACCVTTDDCPAPGSSCVNHRCAPPRRCASRSECVRRNPCEIADCVDGFCQYEARAIPAECCRNNDDCVSHDPHTIGECTPAHTCRFETLSPNLCPTDGTLGEGCPCEAHAECDTGDPCSRGFCFRGRCHRSPPTPGCCVTAADCPDDANPCTEAVCEQNICRQAPLGGARSPEGLWCCTSNAECDDNLPTTHNVCVRSQCETYNLFVCERDEDCDDGNDCTINRCAHGLCRFLPPSYADPDRELPDECCMTVRDCPAADDPCLAVRCRHWQCRIDPQPCTGPARFVDHFRGDQLPGGWLRAIHPSAPPAAGYLTVGPATVATGPSHVWGSLTSPWLTAAAAGIHTLQFDHRLTPSDEGYGGVIANLAVRVTTGGASSGASSGRLVWEQTPSVALANGADDWTLVTVSLGELTVGQEIQVQFEYHVHPTVGGLIGAPPEWQVAWVAVDQGVPPHFVTAPPVLEVVAGSQGSLTVIATDSDPWHEQLRFQIQHFPGSITLLDNPIGDCLTLAQIAGHNPIACVYDTQPPGGARSPCYRWS